MNFRTAQLQAVNDTLALANQTRQAWINAVAAFETVSHLKRAKATSDAGSELARKLGETGALNKAGQAREQAFNAELAGQLAQARLTATRAKEDLNRLMGLWGGDVAYYVPNALPALPRTVGPVTNIEGKALRNLRSEARAAEAACHGAYRIARHYRDVLAPLRRTVEEEGLLSYNGMITSTF